MSLSLKGGEPKGVVDPEQSLINSRNRSTKLKEKQMKGSLGNREDTVFTVDKNRKVRTKTEHSSLRTSEACLEEDTLHS